MQVCDLIGVFLFGVEATTTDTVDNPIEIKLYTLWSVRATSMVDDPSRRKYMLWLGIKATGTVDVPIGMQHMNYVYLWITCFIQVCVVWH